MIIIAAADIPCPVCKAEPGARCRFVSHQKYRGELMRHGQHNRRVWDANEATQVANTLLS